MSLCMLSSRPIAGRDTSRAEEKVHPGVDTTPPNGRGVRERGVRTVHRKYRNTQGLVEFV